MPNVPQEFNSSVVGGGFKKIVPLFHPVRVHDTKAFKTLKRELTLLKIQFNTPTALERGPETVIDWGHP